MEDDISKGCAELVEDDQQVNIQDSSKNVLYPS
jgi:hypothetical protein